MVSIGLNNATKETITEMTPMIMKNVLIQPVIRRASALMISH